MEVGIVTVGDELLSGDTENTNATWLCRQLTGRGARVRRVMVVPDEISEIVRVVREAHRAYDAVVVTGGLGPTHDDRTMAAIAEAFDRPLEPDDRVRAWLVEGKGYATEELTNGTLEIPSGGTPLHNEVGVAPGVHVDNVYILPGVPREMRGMFDAIADDFEGEVRTRETIHVDEPESALVDRFKHLRSTFAVDVGSYPGDHVRVVIYGMDPAEVRDATAWFRANVRELPPEDRP